MPSTPELEFAVGDSVVCIHTKSENYGKHGEVTAVITDKTPVRFGVLWTGKVESLSYLASSIAHTPVAFVRTPDSVRNVVHKGISCREIKFNIDTPNKTRAAKTALRQQGLVIQM